MFTLTIKTDNEAFSDGNKAREVARILFQVIGRLDVGRTEGPCMDTNGNKVGEWFLN